MTNANAEDRFTTPPESDRDELVSRVVATLERNEPLTFEEATELALPDHAGYAHLLAAWDIYRHDLGRGLQLIANGRLGRRTTPRPTFGSCERAPAPTASVNKSAY